VRASLPANPQAAQLYSAGLQKLRLFDALAARDLLEKATALDPNYAPAHSALAQAWSTLGYDDKAKGQARRALDLSANFSREDRLLIEGRSHELLAEQPKAIENYRALWGFFPDRVDYGLFLIRAEVNAGRAAEADATIAELRKLRVSDADAARIRLSDASIAHALSDFKRQQASAEQAATLGGTIGANLLVAEALQVEADAIERMGQSDKAIQLATQSRELYSSAGYRQGAARTLLMHGDVLFDEGDFESAKKKFDEALLVFQEIGAQKSTRAAFERIGNVEYAEGKLQESKKYYERVLQFDTSIHDPTGLASDYGNMANALDGLGDLTGALKMQQQTLVAFNEIGDRRGAAATLNNLGNLFVEMGNLDEAQKNFEQSLALVREITYKGGEPFPVAGMGDILLARGDLGGATKQYEQALALCAENKDEDFAAQIHTSMAVIALLEKRFSDGEALARQTAVSFEKSNSQGNNAWAHALIARNLLSEGKVAEARDAAAQAMALSVKVAGETPRYEAVLAEARVRAKSGKNAEAITQLQTALASARKFGYRLYEFQLRLALGEIETQPDDATPRAALTALEKDARERGAGLVADQARLLLHQNAKTKQ
jgi:tetratricopeptide (TPR) repeat protein